MLSSETFSTSTPASLRSGRCPSKCPRKTPPPTPSTRPIHPATAPTQQSYRSPAPPGASPAHLTEHNQHTPEHTVILVVASPPINVLSSRRSRGICSCFYRMRNGHTTHS